MNQPAIDGRQDEDERVSVKQLEACLQSRLNGRVRDLRLVSTNAGIVLHGFAASYYAKQLAQHEFMNLSVCPLLANEIVVRWHEISLSDMIE
ncbi:hypothetical protein ETAA8_44010 [Anatilimnocola aggregata]|uniref:BON domain-containing protein n=1 Tax=Anatilimnocola aggregata TaxID=2528021 RepID=A0A517YGD5_9BACT|nr:hypothetical protein [Anatilimnocola aggregata]QDU29293.1 hypothetical protein ETAA8_44010 [Anatilimnocola aggregata]